MPRTEEGASTSPGQRDRSFLSSSPGGGRQPRKPGGGLSPVSPHTASFRLAGDTDRGKLAMIEDRLDALDLAVFGPPGRPKKEVADSLSWRLGHLEAALSKLTERFAVFDQMLPNYGDKVEACFDQTPQRSTVEGDSSKEQHVPLDELPLTPTDRMINLLERSFNGGSLSPGGEASMRGELNQVHSRLTIQASCMKNLSSTSAKHHDDLEAEVTSLKARLDELEETMLHRPSRLEELRSTRGSPRQMKSGRLDAPAFDNRSSRDLQPGYGTWRGAAEQTRASPNGRQGYDFARPSNQDSNLYGVSALDALAAAGPLAGNVSGGPRSALEELFSPSRD